MDKLEEINNFDKKQKGSLGKDIYMGFDYTLKLPLEKYLFELNKYLKRTKDYKNSDNKYYFLFMMLEHSINYYSAMNKITIIDKKHYLDKF